MTTIRSIKILTLRYARWLYSDALGQHGDQSKALRKHAKDLRTYAKEYTPFGRTLQHINRECLGAGGIITALRNETGHSHFDPFGIQQLAAACEELQRLDIKSAEICLDASKSFLKAQRI